MTVSTALSNPLFERINTAYSKCRAPSVFHNANDELPNVFHPPVVNYGFINNKTKEIGLKISVMCDV